MRRNYPEGHKINRKMIPNIATVFNMFLGFLALTFIYGGNYIIAGWLIILAGVFDGIDGKLARKIGVNSKFGTEFDSLADTVSFCAVPSFLVFSLYVNGLPFLLAGIISFFPLLFGTIRLARFNLLQEDSPKNYYTGLTTTFNGILIISFMIFNDQLFGHSGDPRIALVMVIALSFMMISKIRFAKFPLLSFKRGRNNNLRLVGVLVTGLAMVMTKGIVLFPIMSIYVVWSIIKWMLDHNRFENEIAFKTSGEKK